MSSGHVRINFLLTPVRANHFERCLMRKAIKTVFLYTELSDAAKAVARQWWRADISADDFGDDYVLDDAAEIADIMGIDLRQTPKNRVDGTSSFAPSIYYSGFSSQGDGASFKGTYKYKKGACKALKAYAPKDVELQRICKALKDAQRKVFYSATCNISTRGYYNHSGTMQFNFDMNDVSTDTFNDVEETISQALRDFADWIYSQLEKEYEYQNSDVVIEETLVSNGYEFNEDGSIA